MVAPVVAAAGINAASSLVGSLFGGGSNNHAGRDQRQATTYANRSAILDKVAAAREAGISPLYALGAPTISASSAVGSPSNSSGIGGTLAGMGQDISRAVAAGQTDAERQLQQLTLDKAKLENEYLAAQITSVRTRTIRESGPPLPSASLPGLIPEKVSPPQRTTGVNAGTGFATNPYFSDGQTWEDRYGDSEILSTLYGLGILGADAYWNLPNSAAGVKGIATRRSEILKRGTRYR